MLRTMTMVGMMPFPLCFSVWADFCFYLIAVAVCRLIYISRIAQKALIFWL